MFSFAKQMSILHIGLLYLETHFFKISTRENY